MHSSASIPAPNGDDSLRDAAAHWVVRQDRGLDTAEAADFAVWRAADPRHAAAFARAQAAWRLSRELGAVLHRAGRAEATPKSRWSWAVAGGLAAAAALAFFSYAIVRTPRAEPPARQVAQSAPQVRQLADGSTVRLKEGAAITEKFSPSERRIKLERGEAFFSVTKDPARPFFVEAGHVTARAVGTAFSVKFDAREVGVLVTEGTVQVTPPLTQPSSAPALVEAGHLAVVATQSPAIMVKEVTATEIARALAWSDPMLELAGAALGDLVKTFSQRTGRRIEIADPALAAVRIGGQFPSNDLDGFLRALDEVYDVKSERAADGGIVLRKAR